MAIFSLSGFAVSELHAINTQSPSETNLTPAAVTGGLHVIISNNDVTSSSDNLKIIKNQDIICWKCTQF